MIAMAQEELDVMRLTGAAHRMAQVAPEVDKSFLGTSGGSVARYIFGNTCSAPESARQLVAAQLISSDDPIAVALQEKDPAQAATGLNDKAQILNSASEMATQVSRQAKDRDTMVNAAALRRRMNTSDMSPEAIAVGFETITRKAQSAGNDEATAGAAKAFATIAIAGITERDRLRSAPRRTADRELD